MNHPLKKISSKKILSGGYLSIEEDTIGRDTGGSFERTIVRHPGAVVVLPVTAEGKILLIRQYRYPVADYLLEFPAGTIDSKVEPPLECAKRELAEETANAASEWHSMGILYPAPGFCDEVQHCFVAKNLTPAKGDLDEDEIIEVQERTISEVEKAIISGEMRDGKSIAVFTKAKLLGLI